ncbi:MAG TPA: hypothetical protein VLL52_17700 [Anaerolineae bacterium]|nr:hypothetical protein [Anaerolineae bacterium]
MSIQGRPQVFATSLGNTSGVVSFATIVNAGTYGTLGFAENKAEMKVILGVDPRFREDDSPDRAVNGCDVRKADSICAGMTALIRL